MTNKKKCLIGLRIAIAYLYSYHGGVYAILTTKPRDMVAEKGSNVSINFSTDKYRPDFYRTRPNSSTEVGKPILSNGGLVASTEDYSLSTTNGYYEVTILHVTPKDGGTYVATDHDGFESAKKSSAELTIIDGPPNIMKGKNFISWNFPHWGNTNITVTCVNAQNVTVLEEVVYGGRTLSQAEALWYVANISEVTHCMTVILPSPGCEQCDEYVYRHSTWILATETRSTTDSSPQADGSNAGAIVGIVIAVVFVVGAAAVAVAVAACVIRRRRKNQDKTSYHGVAIAE